MKNENYFISQIIKICIGTNAYLTDEMKESCLNYLNKLEILDSSDVVSYISYLEKKVNDYEEVHDGKESL